LPPVEFCRGTRPSQAANSRPLRRHGEAERFYSPETSSLLIGKLKRLAP